jgi:UDP-N-acetylmuramoyl-tripeptide--D-alanyl-D-alanine ligase
MDISSIYQIFLNSNKVCTDSRKIKDNDLFFSLKGPNFNGNKFAKTALENGANYAIVDEKEYAVNNNYILVDNCLEILQKLANHHRNKSKMGKRDFTFGTYFKNPLSLLHRS